MLIHNLDRTTAPKVHGNYRRCAKVVSMDSTGVVVAGPNLSASDETEKVPANNVLALDAIECTQHQVSAQQKPKNEIAKIEPTVCSIQPLTKL